MGSLLQDLGYGWRMLAKRPGFTLTVILCLALGIGANTATFSVVNAVLLRPLPYPDPDRLVMVREVYRAAGEESESTASAASFLAWKERGRLFADLAAIVHRNYSLTGGDGAPEHLQGARVSPSLFALLGVRPQRGRLFTAEEDRPGAPFAAVVSDGLWHRRFGADPDLIGKTFNLNGAPFTVVGILPPGFQFPDGADVWASIQIDPAKPLPWHDLDVVARLKPGVSLERAQAELAGLSAQLARERPDTQAGWGARAVPLKRILEGDVRPALLILLGAVAFVLAIACANVANLELARVAERDREVAVRIALGAGRGRLVRQFLAESVLLSLLGGGGGLLLAYASLRPLVALSPVEVPGFRQVSIDGRVLAFTLVAAVVTGLLFGLVPALKISRPEIGQLLKEGSRGSAGIGGRRFRGFLVMAEIGLALVLLVGAGLMLRSFWRLGGVTPGFDPRGALTVRLNLPSRAYPTPERRFAFYRAALDRIAALPGVREVALTTTLPLARENITDSFTVEGRPAPAGEMAVANTRMISPGYFQVMRMPLRAGRAFTAADDVSARPVVVVSESMARRYWPDEDPVGRRVKKGGSTSTDPWITVVGVVADVKDTGLDADPGATWYMPFAQNAWDGVNLVARTAGAPLSLAPALRRAIWSIDPNQAVYDVATLEDLLAGSVARPRFSVILLLLFSTSALLLAAVGLYGVLSYSVRQRLNEIGIRMALGARPADVLGMVVRQGMALAATGIALGIVAALGLTRLLRSQLFEISPSDPWTYVVLSIGLAAVALAANLLPARRATRVDPVISLKRG
jgi:putative ABC transport system permease protein